jgi:hypothetical protein
VTVTVTVPTQIRLRPHQLLAQVVGIRRSKRHQIVHDLVRHLPEEVRPLHRSHDAGVRGHLRPAARGRPAPGLWRRASNAMLVSVPAA